MEMQELEDRISVTLTHLFVSYKVVNVMRGMSVQFLIEDFGTIVCCINRLDYRQVQDKLATDYEGWRTVYVSTQDDLTEVRYEILWALMRSGYMKWLRMTYPQQMKNVLVGTENLGTRIIKERLRLWGDRPRNSFWIEDNEFVLANGILQEYSRDPGFFDYMPEIL